MIRKTLITVLAASLAAVPMSAYALEEGEYEETCPDYSNAVQNPSTPCFMSRYPFVIGGQETIQGDGVGAPAHRHRRKTCRCSKYYYSVPRGYWHPTRVVDVTKSAQCSPSFGKMVSQTLKAAASVTQSDTVGGGVQSNRTEGFYHVHSWQYPSSFSGLKTWEKGGYFESSLTNPYWTDQGDTISSKAMGMWLYPDFVALAQMDSIERAKDATDAKTGLLGAVARAAMCVSASTGLGYSGMDNAFWLGGCSENSLPVTGFTSASSSTVRAHDAILSRYIAQSNRMGGFASVTNVGDGALCSAVPQPFPKKSDFKIAMLAPYSENSNGQRLDSDQSGAMRQGSRMDMGGIIDAGKVMSFVNISSRCDHRLGASEYLWGTGKSDQKSKQGDESASYLIWRWVDSCWG